MSTPDGARHGLVGRSHRARSWSGPLQRPAWLAPVAGAWAATHALVVVLAWAAIRVAHDHGLIPVQRFRSVPRLLAGWDGGWYRAIAIHGYPHVAPTGKASSFAFFPLLPLLIRAAHWLGLSAITGALVVAGVASFAALVAVGCVTESVLGPAIARRSCIYLAISPMAFVFSLAYAEGLLLACAFGAVALVFRHRPWLALPLAFAAGLSRPTGALICIPLAALALRARPRSLGAFLAAAAPIMGIASYAAWCRYSVGDALAFSHAQAGWGRAALSTHGLLRSVRDLATAPTYSRHGFLRDRLAVCVIVGLWIYAAVRRIPPEWLAFAAASILAPLASGSLASMARFSLFCIPAFWALALLGRNRAFNLAYATAAPALLALGVFLLPLRWP